MDGFQMRSQGLSGVFFDFIFLWMFSRMNGWLLKWKSLEKGTDIEVTREESDNHILLDKRTEFLSLHFQLVGFC